MAVKWVMGSTTTAVSLAATLANGSNTYNGLTGCTHTLVDNSTSKYPHAKFVFGNPDTFASAPTAGGTIDIYMTEMDIDGTSDETPEPGSGDIIYLGRYIGSIELDNQDVANLKPLIVRGCLDTVSAARFNFVNNSGVTLSYTSGAITLKVTPFSHEDA